MSTKTKPQATGLAEGANKGFIVTRRALPERQSRRKGRLGNRVKLIRSVIREVCGWAPYERRIQEILKGGGNNPQKRAQRFAKKRLGTHQRAKRKVAEMMDIIARQARAQAQQQQQQQQPKAEEAKKQQAAPAKKPAAAAKAKSSAKPAAGKKA